MFELVFESLTEDHSRSLRLRAVGIGSAGEGWKLPVVADKKLGSRNAEGNFLFFLNVILLNGQHSPIPWLVKTNGA